MRTKKNSVRVFLLLFTAGLAGNTRSEVVFNLLADPGFEALKDTEPDHETTPWFTLNEGSPASFRPASNPAHGGIQSVVYNYYADNGAIIQNTGQRIESGTPYELSFWMLIADPCKDTRKLNAPALSISLWTSVLAEGPYTCRHGLFNNTPTAVGEWQFFSRTITAGELSSWTGEYAQVRIVKKNENVTHRIFIDNASFGSKKRGTPSTTPSPDPVKKEAGLKDSPYRLWVSSFGLQGMDAQPAADPDGDGANNLREYGFGGNPTHGADMGMVPVYGDIGNNGPYFSYIYPRRIDAADHLTYLLERDGVQADKSDCKVVKIVGLDDQYEAVVVQISPMVKKNQDIKIRLLLNEDHDGSPDMVR